GEFEQRVAVKLTHQSIFSDELEKRFRIERQILASLEHPNIVKLLDGGITKDRVPFYVMEYVEGHSLINYCRENDLDIEQRLKLFLQICEAVAYAHRRLIVHRDIKPSNIFVTKKGRVKLLDFGIAKILDTDSDFQTMTQNAPLTPGYSSPEQIRGDIISTASDIFSLGIILYELLTEKNPTEMFGVDKLELSKAICEVEPQRPSRNVAEKNLFDLLSKQEKKDLDNVILKAMRTEPENRYASVENLADDIKSYLKGLPVKAHPQSFKYQVSKFIRRNSFASAIVSFLILLVISGFIIAVWQAVEARQQQQIAEKRFTQVRKIANSLIFDYYDQITKLQGSTKIREQLVGDAMNYLDILSEDADKTPELQREIAIAYRRIGDVQGASYEANSGNTKSALANYQKSMLILEKLSSENPSNLDIGKELAILYTKFATAELRTSEMEKSEALIKKGIELNNSVLMKEPDNLEWLRLKLQLLISFGDVAETQVRLERLLASKSFFENTYQKNLNDEVVVSNYCIFLNRLGSTYRFLGKDAKKDNKFEKAEKLYKKSTEYYLPLLQILEELSDKFPDNNNYQRNYAGSSSNLAKTYINLGEIDKAESLIKKPEKFFLNQMKQDKNNHLAKLDVVEMHQIKSRISAAKNETDSAIKEIDKAIKLARESFEEDSMDNEAISWIGFLSQNAAEILDAKQRRNDAQKYKDIYKFYQTKYKEKFGKDWTLNF
ncbi:MAG: protein kinase domain-containing protein, partial [Aridibacter sp.]